MVCRGTAASPRPAPGPAGESQRWHLKYLPPSFTDLGVCRIASLTCSSSFPGCCCAAIISLLKYAVTDMLPALLMGSALVSSGSFLEPSDIGSVRHEASFWQLLRDAIPEPPLLPKLCHASTVPSTKPKTYYFYNPDSYQALNSAKAHGFNFIF